MKLNFKKDGMFVVPIINGRHQDFDIDDVEKCTVSSTRDGDTIMTVTVRIPKIADVADADLFVGGG